MKKVLIPTDFTLESLQLIEYAILNFPKTKLNIVLVNGFKLPETRWGLYQFSAGREINRLTTEKYINAKKVFFREHSDAIQSLGIELFTGRNSPAFQNFSEQLEITDAIVPKGDFLNFSHPQCFDPTPFIKKNIQNVIEIPLETAVEHRKVKFSLTSLLNL